MCVLFQYLSGDGVVVYHMIATIVCTEMIFHRSPCVAYRYIIIGGILTFFGSPKQQLKVHHIINDDRALPFILVMVPRADNAGFGFEPEWKVCVPIATEFLCSVRLASGDNRFQSCNTS